MCVAVGRKGGESSEVDKGGAGVNDSRPISSSRMDSRELEESHGGGRMLARCCRLRRRASQRGMEAR